MSRALALGLLLLAACGDPQAPAPSGGQRPPAPPALPPQGEGLLGPDPRSQFYIERDIFLSADEPATVPASEASFLRGDDEVLGFVIAGKARAYAVTMLSYHHVVNDVIAGTPVAVTY